MVSTEADQLSCESIRLLIHPTEKVPEEATVLSVGLVLSAREPKPISG